MSQISYASEALDVGHDRIARIFGRSALACAILPMTVGVTITVLYRFIASEALVKAGLLALPIGALVVILGVAFAITWGVRRQSAARRMGRKISWVAPVALILLLLSNFGVAFGCVIEGLSFAVLVEVEMKNESGAPIDLCTIDGPRMHLEQKHFTESDVMIGSYREINGNKIHIHLEQAGVTKDSDYLVPGGAGWGGADFSVGRGLAVTFLPHGGR